ncbi:MaoC family dehydratase [Rhodococcus rhodochrous]|uniref:MaoC family dehydratase n=1 Tax=Rhodococcus rhodochrous TaxID=1829 RepID=A0AAW4XP00_RHORH|nr:MaoC family dehydratase [Rhodococcus rhodochrous]MCD2114905.1 MaoC family dehydratase [Rhodococcus rhodochrous]
MKQLNSVEELRAAAGTRIGYSSWHTLTQTKIDAFAYATGDHQWIHVDPSRATDGPFGVTIAHGHLLTSLIPMLVWEVYKVDGARMGINYGSNKIRFPSPAPVGSRIRAAVDVSRVDDVASGVQVMMTVTIEREHGEKPVCVAEIVGIYVFN